MSSTYIPAALRRQVEERADGRCEYCLIDQDDAYFSFHCDHIIAEKHGGATTLDNLALTCATCNRAKGSDIASLDEAGRLQPLYNPRSARWNEHFELDEEFLVARTSIGEATLRVLVLNDLARLLERQELIESGLYPPGGN